MDNQLKKFKHIQPKRTRVTSVNLRADHVQFVKTHNLNVSAILRDAIDRLMASAKRGKE